MLRDAPPVQHLIGDSYVQVPEPAGCEPREASTAPLIASVRKSLKRSCLHTVKAVGGFNLLANCRWRNERLLILCYHGVSLEDEHEWDGNLYISAAHLESRLRMLRKHYCVLSLDEALDSLQRGNLPRRSVAVTFDDGFYDLYSAAWPLLDQYRIPFTVYQTTYYCEFQRPIFRLMCSYLLWKRRGRLLAPFRYDGSEIGLDLRTSKGRTMALAGIDHLAESRDFSGVHKDELARALAAHLGLDYDALLEKRILHLMKPAEISQMAGAGIQFGLHTHNHRTPHAADEFAREMRENHARILRWTGQEPRHFCYPSGVHRADMISWLSRNGIRSATTCQPGLAAANNDLMLLPRVIDHSHIAAIEYESWLCGFGSFIPRVKEA